MYARGNRDELAADLTLGLHLVLWWPCPACRLGVLAEPITRLLFQHGQFTGADTVRTSHMIAA